MRVGGIALAFVVLAFGGAWEECGLYDGEIAKILNNDDMTFAIDEDIGRKDLMTGDIWTLVWVRTGKGG